MVANASLGGGPRAGAQLFHLTRFAAAAVLASSLDASADPVSFDVSPDDQHVTIDGAEARSS